MAAREGLLLRRTDYRDATRKAERMDQENKRTKGTGRVWNRIRRMAALLILCLSILEPAPRVYAFGAIGDVSGFDSLSGDAKYLGSQYRDHYSLDIEETGPLDVGYTIMNFLANAIFTFIRWMARLTVTLFYICFDLNLSQLFGTQINQVQAALNNSIFQPLFLLGCCGAFCVLLLKMWKQDLAGVIGQLAKVIGIVMLSVLVVTHSDAVLTCCTAVTKEISVGMLSGVNGAGGLSQNINDFAAQGAGILWQNLIHEPWKSMEFDTNTVTEEDIEAFLTTSPGSEEREALVAARDWSCFRKERTSERFGFLILYLIPFLVKCGIYLVVAVLQLIFQLLAIFYVFMAPLILILAMLPDYERLLGLWLRKILESQISIMVLTLMIGILIQFDRILFEWARTSQMGWLVALALQAALAIGLFFYKDKLLVLLSNVQRGIATPGFAANRFRMGGNIYQRVAPEMFRYGGKMGRAVKRGASQFWSNLEEGEKIRTAPPEKSRIKNYSADGWEAAGTMDEEKAQSAGPQYFWTWDPVKQSRIQETRARLPENNKPCGQKELAANPKTPVDSGPSYAVSPESAPAKRPALSLRPYDLHEKTHTEGGGQAQKNQEPLQDWYSAASLGADSRQRDPMKREKPGQGDRIQYEAFSQEAIPKQVIWNRKEPLCNENQERAAYVKPATEAGIKLSGMPVTEKCPIENLSASGTLVTESAAAFGIGIKQEKIKRPGHQAVQENRNIAGTEIWADKQTIKQTEKQAVKYTENQTGNQTEKQAVKQALVQTTKLTGKQAMEQMTKLTGKQVLEQTTKRTGKQAVEQTTKRTEKQVPEQSTKQTEKQAEKQPANTQQTIYRPILMQPDGGQEEKGPLSLEMTVHIQTERDNIEKKTQLEPGGPKQEMELEVKPSRAARENRSLLQGHSTSKQSGQPGLITRPASEPEHKTDRKPMLSSENGTINQTKEQPQYRKNDMALQDQRARTEKEALEPGGNIYLAAPASERALKQPGTNPVPSVVYRPEEAGMTKALSPFERKDGQKELLPSKNKPSPKVPTQTEKETVRTKSLSPKERDRVMPDKTLAFNTPSVSASNGNSSNRKNSPPEPGTLRMEGMERMVESTGPKEQIKPSISPQFKEPAALTETSRKTGKDQGIGFQQQKDSDFRCEPIKTGNAVKASFNQKGDRIAMEDRLGMESSGRIGQPAPTVSLRTEGNILQEVRPRPVEKACNEAAVRQPEQNHPVPAANPSKKAAGSLEYEKSKQLKRSQKETETELRISGKPAVREMTKVKKSKSVENRNVDRILQDGKGKIKSVKAKSENRISGT